MSNWDIPRHEAVQIVVNLRRRDYDIGLAAQHVAQQHYIGKDRSQAVRLLMRDAVAAFYTQHAGLTEAQEEIQDMAETLEEEGWKLANDPGHGFLWYHTSGVDVNRGGGLWDTMREATLRTFESQTRAHMLQDHESQGAPC